MRNTHRVDKSPCDRPEARRLACQPLLRSAQKIAADATWIVAKAL